MKKSYACFLLAAFTLLSQAQLNAQTVLSRSVFSTGGAPVTNGNVTLNGTLAQPLTGFSGTADFTHSAGFWNGFDLLTSVAPSPMNFPEAFRLYQNYPNPFNPVTRIRYALPTPSQVKIAIYNLLGQRVTVLLDEEKPAGEHIITFDGSGYASGVYIYRMETEDYVDVRRLLLVR